MPGLFITLEGGDGAGKTTQSKLLVEWLEAAGHTVVVTREPGGTDLGVELREIVLHRRGDMNPRAEALIYAADRAHHIATVVRPALERGDIVVQDRYIDSSEAYQGAGRVLGAEEVRELSLWATQGLLPDVTVLLDLDPADGRKRLDSARTRYDRLEAEKQEFHVRVREAFLARAVQEPDRILVVDAARDLTEIATVIRERIQNHLPQPV
ncbi:MAG: dTMP kinase [Rhodoglobus sp.]